MNSLELVESFMEFKDDKHIDRTTLMAILEEVIRSCVTKKYKTLDEEQESNVTVIINPDKGDLEIWLNKIVVPNGEVTDPNLEISLSDARKIEEDFEVGEDVSEEIKLEDFDRRMLDALKKGFKAKVLEYYNINDYKRLKETEGAITNAEVYYDGPRWTILRDDNGTEIQLDRSRKIPSDHFRKGDFVRVLIEKVELKGNKIHVEASRTSPVFLERLFEQEIPEVFDGLITIKNVARIPGEKAKVAVDSYDDRIDPVGSCVGVRGARIHTIVRELGNENIDVISYTNNPLLYIKRVLGVSNGDIKINEVEKTAQVYLGQDEISRAIGKGGSNIKLASRLTGYEIDIFREGSEEDVELSEFSDEIELSIIESFKKVGLNTAKSILEKSLVDLVTIVNLEEEVIREVISILKSEFEDSESSKS